MNNDTIFLLDANSLITPHLTFYPFDFAPSFWSQLETHIESGRIAILDMVKDEVTRGTDALADWIKELPMGLLVDRRSADILSNLQKVLTYVQTNPCYKQEALYEWSKATVADAWLIATAMTYGYTIVTFEERNGNLSERQPSKNPKIPDVADAFGVKVVRLYEMMRDLEFLL